MKLIGFHHSPNMHDSSLNWHVRRGTPGEEMDAEIVYFNYTTIDQVCALVNQLTVA